MPMGPIKDEPEVSSWDRICRRYYRELDGTLGVSGGR